MSSTTTKTSTVRDKLNSTILGLGADANGKAPLGDILAILLDTRNANTTVNATTMGAVAAATVGGAVANTGVTNPANAGYTQVDQTALAVCVLALVTQLNLARADILAIVTELTAARVDILALRASMAAINTAGTVGGATQTGVSVTAGTGVATALSQAPTANGLITVNATAGTTTGVKKIIRDNSRAPVTGEVYWDGGVNLTFAIVDAVTACDVIYAKSDLSQKVSCLLRTESEF
jgi:hypothetical protein